ncbi:hypothetical protein HK105_208900 [Polyrhizophydium stewartii]|uniref:Cytochrome b-c1 complex subunit 6 n=1 Tax=Polyrhizophydium stewartii TaxID=2732419 RepID=A0ABR4MWJ8_9FUNG
MSDKAGSEDPKPQLEEECGDSHHCHSFKERLEACSARVEGGESEGETCVEEFFDFMECVNHCVAPKLFSKLH